MTWLLAILLALNPAGQDSPPAGEAVYLIPVQGEISPGLIHPFARGLEQARREGAVAVILLMDTPGGRVDSTMEIIDLLEDSDIPAWTLVDDWALSAGAFIAVATDRIYMTERSVIGAATPILSSPMGGTAEMPESVEEKMTSALAATIEATAAAHGHSPELVRAMVDRDVEIPDPDQPGEFISQAGKLLTLTASRADELGFSAGTVKNLDDLLRRNDLDRARRIFLELSPAEKVARALTSSTVTVILLLAGLGGIYLEFKTPGFGLPGILGICCLGLFFFGQYVGGLAGYEEIALFLAGALLLFLELFVTPGFGVAGVAGIILTILALILAMARGPLFDPDFTINPDYPRALATLGQALVGLAVLALAGGRLLHNRRSPLARRLILKNDERTYLSSDRKVGPGPGQRGVAVTVLRPAGKAEFAGRVIDVVSRAEFIPAGTELKIIRTEGTRVVVQAVKSKPGEKV